MIRIQNDSMGYNEINRDVFNLFSHPLRERDINSLGCTCKHLSQLSQNAAMWQELCQRVVKFGSEIIPLSNQSMKEAFKEALKKRNPAALLSKVYVECENRYAKMDTRKTLKILNKLFSSEPDESILNKALLKKAEVLTAKTPDLKEVFDEAVSIVDGILSKDTALLEEKAVALFLKAKMEKMLPLNTSKTY